MALDPKGVIGEPAYETGAWLRNPLPNVGRWPDAGRHLARRVDQLADLLGIDRQRIIAWGICQAVLSAVWDIDDSTFGGWEATLPIAERLEGLSIA